MASTAPKNLVLFAMRGTLIERLHADQIPHGVRPPQFSYGKYGIWMRPHAIDVLTRLQKNGADVGIFSSATERNTNAVLEVAFSKFTFDVVFTRDAVKADGVVRRYKGQKDSFATYKDLGTVWCREGTEGRHYVPQRTIMVDEDAAKMRWNCDSLLWVPGFGADPTRTMDESDAVLIKAADVIEGTLLKLDDVRTVLPIRI